MKDKVKPAQNMGQWVNDLEKTSFQGQKVECQCKSQRSVGVRVPCFYFGLLSLRSTVEINFCYLNYDIFDKVCYFSMMVCSLKNISLAYVYTIICLGSKSIPWCSFSLCMLMEIRYQSIIFIHVYSKF